MVLLRKSFPQKTNLQPAAELNVIGNQMDQAQNAVVSMIKEAVRSNRWENQNSPGSAHIKVLVEYEGAWKQLSELPDENAKNIYLDITNTIESAMNDD